jgi:uncharacterized protein YbaR (Trm112 family)
VERGYHTYREFLDLLACPVCQNPLLDSDVVLSCGGCGLLFPIRKGVPLLLPESRPVEERAESHQSNPLPSEVIDLLESTKGYSLNVGGGATPKRFERCVELEGAIFRHTTLIGDVTSLPLASDAFDVVVSLNLLEHVDDPVRATSEMLRVLRPGGLVFIHTAFLQPLHADPFHFYNATEQGVRRWFKQFTIESCIVSPNFQPGFTLAWIASELLQSVRRELSGPIVEQLEGMTVGSLARYWNDPRTQSDVCWEALGRLSQTAQTRVAAGFQLIARKPRE